MYVCVWHTYICMSKLIKLFKHIPFRRLQKFLNKVVRKKIVNSMQHINWVKTILYIVLLAPFYRCRNWGTERLTGSSKDIQLVERQIQLVSILSYTSEWLWAPSQALGCCLPIPTMRWQSDGYRDLSALSFHDCIPRTCSGSCSQRSGSFWTLRLPDTHWALLAHPHSFSEHTSWHLLIV